MKFNVDEATRQRLLKYVAIASEDDCWQWLGAMSGKNPKWMPYKSGLSCNAAKAMYQLFKGEVPEGKKITRVCCNPRCVNPKHLLTDLERFWSKVDKTSHPNGCWIWLDHIKPTGYGEFRDGKKKVRAHRFAYELVNGPIPKGMYLLHSCDNRACVNPAHLSIGTAKENQEDMTRKGRGRVGTRNGSAKLTEQDVMKIKDLLAQGFSQTQIAKRFGVHQTNISEISLGRAWNHLNK
jgi:predicted XRE-type DNA-binding protein